MFEVKKSIYTHSHSQIYLTDLYYFEIYRSILKSINLSFHLRGSDAPLCSIILMYASNLFLEKLSHTEKR